jgi:hypothetical protein
LLREVSGVSDVEAERVWVDGLQRGVDGEDDRDGGEDEDEDEDDGTGARMEGKLREWEDGNAQS